MALNLSESRRLASRRNVSQPTPPRLAPLPDSAPGGSLRQHLQQQRKMSRTVSPKPDRSPRIGAGRIFNPLQSAFEPEGGYRYHFSQSTLARAQKAKEYLDLMAQYRRVLELVAPLDPPRTAGSSAVSPPGTPNSSTQVSRVSTAEQSDARIGRPYNPLQYIRNRKVRARERKVIDGEAQGFNDVSKVSEWIDDVAKWVATGQARTPGNPALPPFPGAQITNLQSSPPSTNPRTVVATGKSKRPRVDWVIDPADMIADVYWLELDDNKKLVEDRHRRRIFPQGPNVPQGPSCDDAAPRLTTPGRSAKDSSDALTSAEKATPEPPPSRHDHEHVLSAARDRAQQKLKALKSSHHRHASAITSRDLLRLHRGSLSESSDTDSDRRRRAGSGIPASTIKSVLEKQMEEMIAREQRDAESHPLYDHETSRIKVPNLSPMTPERDRRPATNAPTTRQRLDSRTDLSEAEGKNAGSKMHATGRASLEVPSSRRFSINSDTSQPNSPDLRPARDIGRVPAIGDLSPMSSRPSSPPRNPLKVMNIFRERSKERSSDVPANGDDSSTSPPGVSEILLSSPEMVWNDVSPASRKPSRSPTGGRILGHRSHKSTGNARLRGEDGGISFRSLLRGGPRIDTVLRSSVSKVSDMLWRRDTSGLDDQSSSTSSDDSDDETRGRPRGPRDVRRTESEDEKSPLEGMPDVLSAANLNTSGPQGQLSASPPAQPLSRRSSRFDLLKPPRIDVHSASPSQSPTPQVRHRDQVDSDMESHADRDCTASDSVVTSPTLSKHYPLATSRHWLLTNRYRTPSHPGGSGTAVVSKREIARVRALLLSAGIHAMEMDRRAGQLSTAMPKGSSTSLLLPSPEITTTDSSFTKTTPLPLLPQTHIYPFAARTLSASVQSSASHFHTLASHFAATTSPALIRRAEALQKQVADDLTALAQSAIDAADDANHDLVVGQRLKVKRAVDTMEKMLRRRRRRFRWVRRAGWLAVEWVLVGFMWYVWFVVMIVRVVFGVGKGVVMGVRWLLWL
ncbi:hypothetical protein N656DRAFT_702208 [Canariomyces notabilis]|uniref:Uncharacterized protein n=1 Tax=Canariomyces notabilis TaxID=2074819 RepID=A0AAN6TLF2_9PEZI|nr:hypothetical protein N656DRAFT_702208 [Canariomyces arenarius]